MSLALPTLVVFLLLVPGFIARSQIKRAERLSLDFAPFGQVVIQGVVWAAVLHLVWVGGVQWLTAYEFRPEILLRLLAADAARQAAALDEVASRFGPISAYLGSLVAFAYLGPNLVRRVVTRLRLDRIDSPLAGLVRFSRAPWYYLLSGADFHADRQPDLIAISAIVSAGDAVFVYTGILEDYFVDTDGRLDRLILSQVMRRPLARDKTGDPGEPGLDRFYPIDGDYFVLRYAEVVTLNVEYIKLARTDDGSADVSAGKTEPTLGESEPDDR